MTTVTRGTPKGLRAKFLLAAFCAVVGCFAIAATSEASTIGVTFTGSTMPDYPTDGVPVLNIQTQHPTPSAGLIDSYTFLGTETGLGGMYGAGPYTYDFMIFHPTGTMNQYTVVYDSGAQTATTEGIQTVNITPVVVQAGDLIGDFGRAIGLSIAGPDPTPYYDNNGLALSAPSGTFTVGESPYVNQGDRTYFIQANFITAPVPEPSSGVLAVLGLAASWAIRSWRRRKSA